jgi:hypothetical protein
MRQHQQQTLRQQTLFIIKKIALLAGIATCVTACQPQPEHRSDANSVVPEELKLSYVQTADPAKDASEEFAKHKIYFVGLTEMGDRLPGTESHDELARKYPSHYVKGSSDTNPTYQEERAGQYAEIFNLVMIRAVTEKH